MSPHQYFNLRAPLRLHRFGFLMNRVGTVVIQEPRLLRLISYIVLFSTEHLENELGEEARCLEGVKKAKVSQAAIPNSAPLRVSDAHKLMIFRLRLHPIQAGILQVMEKWVKSQCGPGMKKKAVVVFQKVFDCVADLMELSKINLSR